MGRGSEPAGRGLEKRLWGLTFILLMFSAGVARPAVPEPFSASPHLPFLIHGIFAGTNLGKSSSEAKKS